MPKITAHYGIVKRKIKFAHFPLFRMMPVVSMSKKRGTVMYNTSWCKCNKNIVISVSRFRYLLYSLRCISR